MGESKMRRRGIVIFVAMMMVTIVLLTGCGSGNSDNNSNSGTASAGSSYNMSEEMKMSDRGDMNDGDAPAVVATSGEAFANRASTSEGASVAPQLSEPANNGLITNTRKLIYRANVTMEVEEYGKAQTELFNLVTLSGGYMLTFNDFRNSYEEGGTFVVKVPANGFQSFLTGLEKLKKDDEFQRNVQGQDVSEEYVDLEARLKAKQVVEVRLLSLM